MRGTAFRVFKNSIALALASGVDRLVTFFLTLYIARSLGPASLGEFTLVVSFLAIFATVSTFGQHILLPREVTRRRSEGFTYLVNSSLIGLVASIPTALALIVTANLLDYSDQVLSYMAIVAVVLIPETLVAIGEAVVQGLEKLEYVTVVRFVSSCFRVAVSLAALYLGYGLEVVFVVWGISQTIAYAIYFWLIFRSASAPQLRLNRTLLKTLLGSSFIFLVVSINAMLFKRIDIVMLSQVGGMDSVGVYAAASKPVLMIDTMAPAFLLSVFPVMSAAYIASQEKFVEISTESLKLVVMVILPLVIVLFSVADKLIPFLFGPEFSSSVPVFQVLVWMLVPGLASSTLFRAVLASNNEKVSLLFGGVKAVVNISLNLFLIPRYGALGAAIAAVATQSVALIQVYSFTSRRLFKIKFMEVFGKACLCAFVSGAIFFYLWQANLNLLLPFALLIYLALLIALRVLSHRELLLIRQLWHATLGTRSAILE